MTRWREWSRRQLAPLLSFHGTPHNLALAFGLGVALGVLPGTGALAAAASASVLRLNVPVAVVGALLNNPLTTPFVYGLSFLIGRGLVKMPASHPAATITVQVVVGCLILAVVLGVVGYAVGYGVAVVFKRARRGE